MAELAKILGDWKTQDDETQEEKSNVRIQRTENAATETYEAVITKLLKLPQDTKLRTGRYEGMPAVGSKVILDLVPYENYWSYGTIIDPTSGSEYSCSVWFENDNFDELFVRGKHWTGIFRTQKWYRLLN
jgi:uncharacterized protein (DUF2147 family)